MSSHRGGMLVLPAALAALLAPADATPAWPQVSSRDARSAAYCSQRANLAGFYDTEAAIACRREEYTAAARTRSLVIPPEIDAYCESLAGEGDPIGPFSWRAFLDCVDGLAQ